MPHVESSPSRFSLFGTSVFGNVDESAKSENSEYDGLGDGFFNIFLFSPLFWGRWAYFSDGIFLELPDNTKDVPVGFSRTDDFFF